MKILTQPVSVQHKINCDKKFENNKTKQQHRGKVAVKIKVDEKTSPFPFCFGRRRKKENVCK